MATSNALDRTEKDMVHDGLQDLLEEEAKGVHESFMAKNVEGVKEGYARVIAIMNSIEGTYRDDGDTVMAKLTSKKKQELVDELKRVEEEGVRAVDELRYSSIIRTFGEQKDPNEVVLGTFR